MKIMVQFFECKIPERVLLNGVISICRRFSKVSHRFEAKMCGLSLLAIFTFWVFALWHMTLVLYSKRKSSITAPAPLTTKRIFKQARLNATKSVLVLSYLDLLSIYAYIIHFVFHFQNVRLKGKKQSSHENTRFNWECTVELLNKISWWSLW